MESVINLKIIPQRISSAEWENVYQESLRLVEAYDFMDRVGTVRNGRKYFYAEKTKDRENLDGRGCHGWRSVGDMRTGDNTEEYLLFEDICAYMPEDGAQDGQEDILLDGLWEGKGGSGRNPSCGNIWGGKSQGEDSHIYLLAIACLISYRLAVSGDISAGQCRKAVRWANQYLGEPIGLPVTGQRKLLAGRLKRSPLPRERLPETFLALTLEAKDGKMGEFLREEFGEGLLLAYYRKQFLQYKASQRGFAFLLKEYLEMGFGFRELCQMAVSAPDGMRVQPEDFLRRVVESKLHIKEKETYDFTKTSRERGADEGVDDIKRLFAKTLGLICGAENRNVNAFYPLESIRADCKAAFGQACDVDRLLGQLLEEEKEGFVGTGLQALLYDGADSIFRQEVSRARKEMEAGKKYDVTTYREMVDFVPGCRVRPELERDLVKNLQMIQYFAEGDFEEFRRLDRIGRENYFIENNRFILLRREVWERIFEKVMDDAYIIRFYGMFGVNCLERDGYWFCKNMLASLQAFDYYWDRIS